MLLLAVVLTQDSMAFTHPCIFRTMEVRRCTRTATSYPARLSRACPRYTTGHDAIYRRRLMEDDALRHVGESSNE